jgi:DNA-binding NarL/FixJ family response regulator
VADARPTARQARVLIVEPAELVRRGIRDVLARERHYLIAGEVASTQILPELCRERHPDVVFLGLAAGDERGLAALERARQSSPHLRVIVLTDSRRVDDLLVPIRAGAKGLLLREAPASTVLHALADVLGGDAALDPRLTSELFQQLAAGATLAGDAPWDAMPQPMALAALSAREREVLLMLTRGRRNKEIAAQLGVSVGTVKTHLRHIFRKLNVADRTGAVLAALRGDLPQAA